MIPSRAFLDARATEAVPLNVAPSNDFVFNRRDELRPPFWMKSVTKFPHLRQRRRSRSARYFLSRATTSSARRKLSIPGESGEGIMGR